MTLTVLNVGSCGRLRVLAISKASKWLNRSDHFWSCSSILFSADDDDGRLDVDLTDLVTDYPIWLA